ncbi:MAG: hypothetical protein P8013_06095 [Candidatus Sulfobium sp.]|jgi:hypothetical protein
MADGGPLVSGGILIYRLYDVAWDIDLVKVEERVREYKRQSIDRKRFSKAFEFANPPLSLRLRSFEKNLDGRQYGVNAFAKAYDYGVLSIIFEIPFRELAISDFESLAMSADEPFREDFPREVDGLVRDLGEALHQVYRSRCEEDYIIYYLREVSPPLKSAAELIRTCDIRGLLLYEEGESPPSEASKDELRSYSFSYSERDLVVLSWDKALVVEPSGSMDIPDLLEFANAQLLELRVYDDMLDRELDNINDRIASQVSPSIWKIRRYEALAARVMRTVMDLTRITERIDNSLKVTEDVYYARVYSSTLSLFKVQQWERSLERKISIATRFYDMLYRGISNKRTELLELIIVILIVIEIVLFIVIKY